MDDPIDELLLNYTAESLGECKPMPSKCMQKSTENNTVCDTFDSGPCLPVLISEIHSIHLEMAVANVLHQQREFAYYSSSILMYLY